MTTEQLELSWANYRKTDPATSKTAAVNVEKLGIAATHREMLLRAVETGPGRTSGELAVACSLNRHEAARRLPELREIGLVRNGEARTCSALGTVGMTWWATKDFPDSR